jgi:hypothetical protein
MHSKQIMTIDSSKGKPMPSTIHYNPEAHIIEVKVKGVVNQEKFKEIFSQGVQLAKEKKCFLFLNDFREATIEMSTMDIFNLPEVLSSISTPLGIQADRFRRALVIAPEYTRDASFAEDVTVNRGQHAKFFHDLEEAKKWLLGK